VSLPVDVAARQGIQPTVQLTSQRGERIVAKVGEPITLMGTTSVPSSAGKIVKTEWSQIGGDDFIDAPLPHGTVQALALHKTFVYLKPGTYYPVLRVMSQRDGNAKSEFARVGNLARVRVVVE
jgi:hypothetical protein